MKKLRKIKRQVNTKMIFSSLFTLIGKNLRLFFRSKVSSVVILLMPVLIVLLAGYGFSSNSLSGVSVATYSDSYSTISDNIVKSFEENNFLVKKQINLEDCINSVKISKNQICVLFPVNLSSKVNEESIVFYVDYSRTNLAYTLINLVSEDVSAESSDIGTLLVQDLIDTIGEFKTSLSLEKSKLDLIPRTLEEIKKSNEELGVQITSLENIIESLEEYENASEIDGDISNLEIIKSNLSTFSLNLNSKNTNLKNDLDSILTKLDLMIISLNSLNVRNAENIVSPIRVSLESITPVNNKRDYLVPTVLALISLFGGILISSTFVLKNKKTLAYFRNFVTPTWDITFILSIYFTCLFILIVQFLLVFVGVHFILGMNFSIFPLELISVLILGWSVFIFIGMFIGYLFRSEETTIFSAVLISSVLMFLSNLILPLENVSGILFTITSYNPFVILENSLKQIYLFGLSFDVLGFSLAVLGGFVLVFGILTYFMRKMTKRVL